MSSALSSASERIALPSWEVFAIFLYVIGACIGLGVGVPLLIALLFACAGLFVWRFPYATFYAMLAASPCLGWIMSVPLLFWTNAPSVIQISIGDALVLLLAIVWLARALTTRFLHGRHEHWSAPLIGAYGILVLGQFLSIFSSASPNPSSIVKFVLHPVAFVYLGSIFLPVTFIRTRRDLTHALAVLTSVGVAFALDGFRSLFIFGVMEAGFHRARPLGLFGINFLGGNHNALGEALIFIVPLAIVLGLLADTAQARRTAWSAALFMTLIALLTFARSAWLALGVEAIFLGCTVWRGWVKEQAQTLIRLALACTPLAAIMTWFSLGPAVQSSTDARLTLADIAWNFFRGNIWLGVGSGTFTERLGNVWLYAVDYGDPIDAHGLIQKIGAESGLAGLSTCTFFGWRLIRHLHISWHKLTRSPQALNMYALLCAAALGAFTYQLFSTSIWTARLWLPIGLALAGGRVLLGKQAEADPKFFPS